MQQQVSEKPLQAQWQAGIIITMPPLAATRYHLGNQPIYRNFAANEIDMKKIITGLAFLVLSICVAAQEPAAAEKGVTYGAGTTKDGAIPVSQVEANMKDAVYTGKATGKVLSVCQAKGCWMKVENTAGETMMVKFKDYGFFMPKDIVGKEVVLDGEATVKETSVKQLRHYAGDAGKSTAEINKITAPKKELIFTAKAVLVL